MICFSAWLRKNYTINQTIWHSLFKVYSKESETQPLEKKYFLHLFYYYLLLLSKYFLPEVLIENMKKKRLDAL